MPGYVVRDFATRRRACCAAGVAESKRARSRDVRMTSLLVARLRIGRSVAKGRLPEGLVTAGR
jgi:hypothetical protein